MLLVAKYIIAVLRVKALINSLKATLINLKNPEVRRNFTEKIRLF